MRVRLLLFALYRDLAGTEQLDVDLPPGATARELVAELRGRFGLDRLPASPALAVNQTWAALSTVLRDGDEVALLPPVAGG
jgi:molybdopterin synthase catalytic subunit